jgi:hypothetical protein
MDGSLSVGDVVGSTVAVGLVVTAMPTVVVAPSTTKQSKDSSNKGYDY